MRVVFWLSKDWVLIFGSGCYQGAVFSVSFSADCPFLLAVGGSKGRLEVSLENHSVLFKLV